MTYSISFLPEVEEDAMNGFRWYEEKAIGLGEEFLRLFYAIAGEINRNPLIYQTVYKDFRRCLLRRFPYAVYYKTGNYCICLISLCQKSYCNKEKFERP